MANNKIAYMKLAKCVYSPRKPYNPRATPSDCMASLEKTLLYKLQINNYYCRLSLYFYPGTAKSQKINLTLFSDFWFSLLGLFEHNYLPVSDTGDSLDCT